MIETIIDALLRVPAVEALAKTIALGQLPQDSPQPALVYNIVSDLERGSVCRTGKSFVARVVVHGIAPAPLLASQVVDPVRQSVTFTAPRVVAGARVSCCISIGTGQPEKDEVTGAWLKPLELELLYQIP